MAKIIDHRETLTGRYLRYGDHTKIPSSQPGVAPYRVTLKVDEHDHQILACECEGYRHRKNCRHQREAALSTLLASACPDCGGRLSHVGQTVAGLDCVACNKCEFAIDFAPASRT